MRILSKRQDQLFAKLVKLANGNPNVVEQALREQRGTGKIAKLEDIIKSIKHTTESYASTAKK